jgi:hypothetical protein
MTIGWTNRRDEKGTQKEAGKEIEGCRTGRTEVRKLF